MYRTRVHGKGQGRPTRDDVAKFANISGATVSRVLSGRTDLSISEETRAKVLDAAEKLGYFPNPSARALMTGSTGLVGFWMSLQYSRYRCQVLDRMRSLMEKTDLALAVTDVDEEYHSHHCFTRALRVPVDGIIAFDTSASIEAFAKDYERLAPRTPFVSMGAYWSPERSFVGVDLKGGALNAMDHLLSRGRKRIAFLAPIDSGLLDTGPRYEAYVEKVSAAGFEPWLIGTPAVTIGALKDIFTDLFQAAAPPDAILCMNDDLALASVPALERIGLKPGKEVALVGFDGIEETEFCSCPITTVRQPIEEMCVLTISFLKDQMEDPARPLQQKILKPHLIIRDSSGA